MDTIYRLFIILLMVYSLICSGEEVDIQSIFPDMGQSSAQAETQQPAVAEYELKTVYLCTSQTMTNYENNSVFTTKFAYDEYGNKVESWREGEDGSKENQTVFTYDGSGNLITQVSGNGMYEYTYTYDGDLESSAYYYNCELKSHYSYIYDSQGYLTEEVQLSFYSEEKVELFVYTYNEDYSQATIDYYANDVKAGYAIETYDSTGNVLLEEHYTADGVWNSAVSYEYDGNGRVVYEYHSSSSDTQPNYDIYYTYSSDGLLLERNVDYYYGYLMTYEYEPFEIYVKVS